MTTTSDPDYDPFENIGTNPAKGLAPVELDQSLESAIALNEWRAKPAQNKKRRPVDHNPRTKDLLESKGYYVEKCEITHVQSERVWKTDLLEVADYIALKPGRILFVQACAIGQKNAHLQKFNKLPHMRTLLSVEGLRVYIVLWDQPKGPGTHWKSEILRVTPELLDLVESRRRK